MGFKTVEWAYTVEGLSGPQKATLVALSFCLNERSGKCCPSQQTLASMTSLSNSTVGRALDGLADLGVIGRERRTDKRGYRTSDNFAIHTTYTSESQVGAEPTRQSAYLAESNGLTVTLQPPTRHSDTAISEQEEEQEKEQEVTLFEPTAPTFSEFWMVWPKKVSRPQAEKAWGRAIKRADPEVIYSAATAYARNPHLPDKQFIPHPATWLNGDRWNDELPGPRSDQRLTPGERNLAYVHRLAAQQAAETRGLTS